MSIHLLVSCALGIAGLIAMILAILSERRMQRQRRPGVSYKEVTLRRDGAWRNDSFFTEIGLRHQRRASTWGMIGTLCWIAALVALTFLPGGS